MKEAYGCQLCEEFKLNKKNILFESPNFFVKPSLGQIVEGYLLICSKEHFIGLGEIPSELCKELEMVQKKVKEVLSEYYTKPIFFEHGPVAPNKKGGCCIEHAHLHAIPVNLDILADISKNFNGKRIKNFQILKEQFKKKIPYFYYENQKGDRFLFELFEVVPSQCLRQLVAIKINAKDKWDWMQYPGLEEFDRTVKKLKDKF